MNAVNQTNCMCLLAGLLLLGACGHDAKRDNPLDPALTPAVQLDVALDDTTGTVTLTWTPYEGELPFAAYCVLRNITGRTLVDTLKKIADVGTTSFVDVSLEANNTYQYRVAVLNVSGLEVVSQEKGVSGYAISSVDSLDVRYDPTDQGGIQLHWSLFRGGRFEAYVVERISTDKIEFEPIGRVDSRIDTVFIDRDSAPNVFYRYRIVVEAAGKTWPGELSAPFRFLAVPVSVLPIELNVNDGTASLAWTPYDGDVPFQSYEIRRQLAGQATADTLKRISDVEQTSFVDDGVEAGLFYDYTVVVLTTTGMELPSDPVEVSFSLTPPVLDVVFDCESLSVELTWTRAGSGFIHYEIERQVEGAAGILVLKRITDIDDTTFVDTDFKENRQYTYAVVTGSTTGRELRSAPVSGAVRTDWQTFIRELADELVNSVYQSSDGAMWFGTSNGVSRYDGVWQTFTGDDGLADNEVWSVHQSSDGAMWFGTGDGVSRYDGVNWQTFRTSDGLAHKEVRSVHQSSDGAMWFATQNRVSRYDGVNWQTFTRDDGLAANFTRSVYQSSDGAMWFGVADGVSRYDATAPCRRGGE